MRNPAQARQPLFTRTGWRRLLWALGLLLALAGVLRLGPPAAAIDRPALNTALLATVRVAVPVAGEQDAYSTGSGTIISKDGLILTNYHVMGDIERQRLYNPDGMGFIAVNPANLRSEPVWTYRATLVKGSAELDLAVLRIDGLMQDAGAALPANLGLTAIALGSSDELQIGDELNVFGFPGIGQGTVNFTSGRVSGFIDDNRDGVFDWIKTDASIAKGNSGGLAADATGLMIGVPTAGVTDLDTASTISLIRPIDLAVPLIRAAQSQVNTTESDRGREGQTGPGARIANLQFATAVDREGKAIRPALRFGEDTSVIYAVFDYDGFTDAQTFEYIWYLDGFQVLRDSLEWSSGKSGGFWVNIYADPSLDSGFYEVELRLNRQSLYRGGFMIGDAAAPVTDAGSFGPITFAEGVSSTGAPAGPGTSFTGVTEVYAFFDVNEVPNGVVWSRRWFIDGELAVEADQVWDGGAATRWWVSVRSADGLPPGRYRLELAIEGRMVQQGEFDVVERTAATPAVSPVNVIGAIRDVDNSRTLISGATVVFLKPGVAVSRFLDQLDESLIHGRGVTDANGDYQLDAQLRPGEGYGVVIYHQHYRTVTADGFVIDPAATSPWRVDATMKRR